MSEKIDLAGTSMASGTVVTVLTKRELFAAMAMQGLLAAPSDACSRDAGPNARANPSKAAAWAIEHADALLSALSSEPSP